MKSRFEAQIRASEAESIFVSRSIKSSTSPPLCCSRTHEPRARLRSDWRKKSSAGTSQIISFRRQLWQHQQQQQQQLPQYQQQRGQVQHQLWQGHTIDYSNNSYNSYDNVDNKIRFNQKLKESKFRRRSSNLLSYFSFCLELNDVFQHHTKRKVKGSIPGHHKIFFIRAVRWHRKIAEIKNRASRAFSGKNHC